MSRSARLVSYLCINIYYSFILGTLPKVSEESCSKRSTLTRYPIQFTRKYIKEYLGEPPFFQHMVSRP